MENFVAKRRDLQSASPHMYPFAYSSDVLFTDLQGVSPYRCEPLPGNHNLPYGNKFLTR